MKPHLTDELYTALLSTARGLGNVVNHTTRQRLEALDLIEHGAPDGWPYWHCTPAGFAALTDEDPAEPDDYADMQADARRDEGV